MGCERKKRERGGVQGVFKLQSSCDRWSFGRWCVGVQTSCPVWSRPNRKQNVTGFLACAYPVATRGKLRLGCCHVRPHAAPMPHDKGWMGWDGNALPGMCSVWHAHARERRGLPAEARAWNWAIGRRLAAHSDSPERRGQALIRKVDKTPIFYVKSKIGAALDRLPRPTHQGCRSGKCVSVRVWGI